SPFNPLSCPSVIADVASNAAQTAGTSAIDIMLTALNDELQAAIKLMAFQLAGWLLVPSMLICPTSGGPTSAALASCAQAPSAANQLRAWVLPITVLVAALELLWQAILMTVTRKGQPLLQAVKGLASVALWGAVG